jgi:AcrR family transcriptional regulator
LAKLVKSPRPYRSGRRQEAAAATRKRILDAARTLFERNGYALTSVVAIAAEADVAPETIYKAFGTKRQILEELIDSSVVGEVARTPMGILQSEPMQRIRAEPDLRRRVAMFAHLTRVILERAGPVHAIIRSAAATDPEVAELRRAQQQMRLRAQIEFVRILAEAGPLRDRLSIEEGGYQYWILATPELQHILVVEQGWSNDRYEAWLSAALAATLLPPE